MTAKAATSIQNYYTKDGDGKRGCKLCAKVYDKTTGGTNLEKHLRSVHPQRFKE
jgi:BED zinc finger